MSGQSLNTKAGQSCIFLGKVKTLAFISTVVSFSLESVIMLFLIAARIASNLTKLSKHKSIIALLFDFVNFYLGNLLIFTLTT